MWDSKVIVSGAVQTPFNCRKDGTGPRDWSAQAFGAALTMAGIEAAQIDALFVASESDFFSLQLNPSSILASELGLTGAAAMRCEGGGASGQMAVHAATMAVQSGAVRHAAVIGVDPSASSLSGDAVRTLYGFSFDAWTDGMTGLTSTALYALSWQAFAAEHGLDAVDLAAVTMQNRANACANPEAHLPRRDSADEIDASPLIAIPYRRLHCSPLSDGAAALILSREGEGTRKSAPRVAGIGAGTDHMHLGARANAGDFAAKRRAMQRARALAGVAPDQIGLAEVYDAYAGAQLQALHALGLSAETIVNLSGGLMGQGAPVGATGVGQVATCARLLEGRYHAGLQPQSLRADTHGGVCTSSAVTILQRGASA